jgi:hypothetical protein
MLERLIADIIFSLELIDLLTGNRLPGIGFAPGYSSAEFPVALARWQNWQTCAEPLGFRALHPLPETQTVKLTG